MSLSTWEKEFYPKPATEATDTPLEAAEHSLQKWIGLREENLEKHGVTKDQNRIRCGRYSSFPINDATCSLCQFANGAKDEPDDSLECLTECPLGFLLQEESSEDLQEDQGCKTQYLDWVARANREPMIEAIERTVEMLKESPEFPRF